jgi:hypothetical protein
MVIMEGDGRYPKVSVVKVGRPEDLFWNGDEQTE